MNLEAAWLLGVQWLLTSPGQGRRKGPREWAGKLGVCTSHSIRVVVATQLTGTVCQGSSSCFRGFNLHKNLGRPGHPQRPPLTGEVAVHWGRPRANVSMGLAVHETYGRGPAQCRAVPVGGGWEEPSWTPQLRAAGVARQPQGGPGRRRAWRRLPPWSGRPRARCAQAAAGSGLCPCSQEPAPCSATTVTGSEQVTHRGHCQYVRSPRSPWPGAQSPALAMAPPTAGLSLTREP